MSAPAESVGPTTRTDTAIRSSIAILVVAQAAVVGLQVIGRHALHRPIPWTEEIARLLLVWLMCAGGIAALRHGQHPRVTALVRLLSEERRRAVDRGLRLVLLAFFACLIVPAYHLTVSSAGESLPASGISGAWISGILPVALVLMSLEVVRQLYNEGGGPWRDRSALT
jgi:TRAP-type C4-dicarboxylate transport system permease small subunit